MATLKSARRQPRLARNVKRFVPAVILAAALLGGSLFATSAFAEQSDCSVITNAGTTVLTCVNPDGTVTTSTLPRTVYPTAAAPAPVEAPFWATFAFSGSAEGANTRADALRAQGLDASVIYSSNYSSLSPGYWVTFVGRYATKAQAQAEADYLHTIGYSDAYARWVDR
jgi:hypothetical protein